MDGTAAHRSDASSRLILQPMEASGMRQALTAIVIASAATATNLTAQLSTTRVPPANRAVDYPCLTISDIAVAPSDGPSAAEFVIRGEATSDRSTCPIRPSLTGAGQ